MGHLTVFTGAGLSAESGVPTFRGNDGLWETHSIAEVCTYERWKDRFSVVHEFYNKRRAQLATVVPNAAHRAIATWQRCYGATVLTQNVDDLLERAGCTGVVHLHGSLLEMKCEACGHVWPIASSMQWQTGDRCQNPRGRTICGCRKAVKPNVVFFGEMAPNYAVLYGALKNLHADDVFVVIGTSAQVVPINTHLIGLPGFKLLNNLDRSTEMPDEMFDRTFYRPATEAVEEINCLLRDRLLPPG